MNPATSLRLQARAARERRTRAFHGLLRACYDDPARFASDVLGNPLWSKQVEIAEAIRTHKRVAVRSGHKIGKSNSAACVGLWWLYTRPRGKVILSSSSWDQVDKILWSEIQRLFGQSKFALPGALLGARSGLTLPDGRTMFGISTNKAERVGGHSGDELLFIIDEASGIEDEIFQAFKGNMAGGARMIMYGNPTQASGEFYDAFHSKRHLWHGIHVSSAETPNVLENRIVIPGLATREWIEEQTEDWGGPGSPLYEIRLAGNFALQSTNAVIALGLIEAAPKRYEETEGKGLLHIGVDVARFGDDDSVIQPRRGLKAYPPIVIHGYDGNQVAGEALKVAREMRTKGETPMVKVDGIGYGSSVVDNLSRFPDEIDVVDVNVAEAASDEKYGNLRAQVWFAIADWLKDGGAFAPGQGKLEGELAAPLYKFDARNRLLVERKEDIKQRLRRSPDRADALALAIYNPPIPPRGMGEDPIGFF